MGELYPTKLENAVMAVILKSAGPLQNTLFAQWKVGKIVKRDYSGVGVFVKFEVPDTLPRIQEKRLVLGDILVHVPEIKHGIGFILFVINGKINTLEGFTFDERWPDKISDFRIEEGAVKTY